MTGAAEPIVRDTALFGLAHHGARHDHPRAHRAGADDRRQRLHRPLRRHPRPVEECDLGGYAIGTLCGSLTLPTIGRLVDRYGVRRAMTTIGVLFALGLTYMSGVQGLVTLTIGFFFIRMLGQGSLSLASTVAISRWFDRRRGLALGIAMTISSALMALVPVRCRS